MPVQYRRDEANRRIVVTGFEPVTIAELRAVLKRQASDGAWSYGVLHDNSAVTGTAAAEGLHELLQLVGVLTTRHGPRGPVALVMPNRALERIGRRYALLGELTALNVRVFNTVADAEQWLTQQPA